MIFVITANQRQANALRQQDKFQKAWITTWTEWLRYLWSQLEATTPQQKHLVSAIELEYLWQQATEKVLAGSTHDTETLAKLACEAYQTLNDYQIPIDSLANYDHGNTQWLLAVFNEVKQQCQQLQLITPTAIPAQLMARLDWLTTQTQQLIFYHFLELTPLQKKLIRALQSRHCQVKIEDFHHDSSKQVEFRKYADVQQEIDHAITTITTAYQKNSQQRLALIVPNLSAWQSYIDAQLKAQLFPNALSPQDLPWHFSLQPRLTDTSFIATALKLIQLLYQPRILLTEFFSLLRSPYWRICQFEPHVISEFMLSCQALACQELDWQTLIDLAHFNDGLETLLNTWLQHKTTSKQSLAHWLEQWQQLLAALNFANEENLTQAELHLKGQWQELTAELSSALTWLNKLSAFEAWQLLQRRCQSSRCTFAAQNNQQPIQIMGMLEALGESYDYAWLVGANAGKIPTTFNVNPLLPLPLQKKYNVLAATPHSQEELAQRSFAVLAGTQQHLIVSFAATADDMPTQAATFCPHDTALIETHAAQQKPRIMPTSNSKQHSLHGWPQQKALPGGSEALKSQQQCSIKAFARHRLDLRALPETTLGLTAMERGNVAHRALQLAWQNLKDQKNLLALTYDELHDLAQRIARIALRMVPWQRRRLLPNAVTILEVQRQTQLLTTWLELEKSRAPFRIHALEKDLTVLFANQKWRLRVDRIDELNDGRLLLIDYKTGMVSTHAWKLDYFSEPQLPLYCVSSGLNFAGLAFVEYSSNTMRFKGIAKEAIDLGNCGNLEIANDWQSLQQGWHDLLTELTQQFVQSNAQVAPNEKLHSCQYCDLTSFCRIFEHADGRDDS